MSKKRHWGTLKCGCGGDARVTSEVISVGYDTYTLFEAICKCGRKASGHYPENVSRDLLAQQKERKVRVD